MCLRLCRRNFIDWSVFRPYRYAHRGLHDAAAGIPENTLPAFRRAVEAGFGAELDVHLTKDGKLVVFHDDGMQRLCGVDRAISDLRSDELALYPILGTQETPPLLEEVLPIFVGKTPLIVEIKPSGKDNARLTEQTCRMLDRFGVTYCVESFDPHVLLWLRKNRPELCRGQLAEGTRHRPVKNRFLCWCLSNLVWNFLTRPDFIAYRFSDRRNFALTVCRKLYGAQEVSWTIRSRQELDAAEAVGSIPIFENFIPR